MNSNAPHEISLLVWLWLWLWLWYVSIRIGGVLRWMMDIGVVIGAGVLAAGCGLVLSFPLLAPSLLLLLLVSLLVRSHSNPIAPPSPTHPLFLAAF